MTGTDFQIKVWQALLKIPAAATTYTDIAQSINHPKAVRAVGTAVGSNPGFCALSASYPKRWALGVTVGEPLASSQYSIGKSASKLEVCL